MKLFFNKFSNKNTKSTNPDNDSNNSWDFKDRASWYEDQYDSVLVQRNRLFILFIMSVVIAVTSIIAVVVVTTMKRFEPLVIAIEDTTGAVSVVKPYKQAAITGNESLARYFITKYVKARETYNPVDFHHNKKVVRLLSQINVFSEYMGYLQKNNPETYYGTDNTTYFSFRSWSKISSDTYVLRFSITETTGNLSTVNKIAVVSITYQDMSLSQDEFYINPVGFLVTAYRSDNDNS